eukprot:PITA_02897
MVNEEDNSRLLKPFTEDEISNVIRMMELDKAPGPDGFSIHFYRICWDISKADLFRMIKGFLQKAKVEGSTNSTFLVLISQEAKPVAFDRFRPIALCNASYKILSKLLANRIKPLLEKLISPNQGGFVKGRHILDNVILVLETIHSSHQREEQGMLIKLDMANAFGRWIAPLVNGRPTNYFKALRGIRQGCPLSPFLYIFMADSLSRKLTAEKLNGTLPGIRAMRGTNPINHAQFADDSLLMGGASLKITRAFNDVSQSFCRVSGALVNRRKSAVYGWAVDQQTIFRIAQSLGFMGFASWDKFKYLGLTLTLETSKAPHWLEIISKIKAKMIAWGGQWLTTVGKLILVKSVLSSLPIYQASFLLAPKMITEQLSKLIQNFLWQGGKGNKKKFHLVSWDIVKRPLLEGGLQVRDPGLANLSLGGKILWKIF